MALPKTWEEERDELRDEIERCHRDIEDAEEELDEYEEALREHMRVGPNSGKECECSHPERWHPELGGLRMCQEADCSCKRYRAAEAVAA